MSWLTPISVLNFNSRNSYTDEISPSRGELNEAKKTTLASTWISRVQGNGRDKFKLLLEMLVNLHLGLKSTDKKLGQKPPKKFEFAFWPFRVLRSLAVWMDELMLLILAGLFFDRTFTQTYIYRPFNLWWCYQGHFIKMNHIHSQHFTQGKKSRHTDFCVFPEYVK